MRVRRLLPARSEHINKSGLSSFALVIVIGVPLKGLGPNGTMRIAIMQPYLFPYFPYFQLIASVDRFVLLDTVQHIRRGWMNRNRIRLGAAERMITFPLKGAPQATEISEMIFARNIEKSIRQIRGTLTHAYGGSPQRNAMYEIVDETLRQMKPGVPFVDVAEASLALVAVRLQMGTPIQRASRIGIAKGKGASYILDICKAMGATEYFNSIGGEMLYEPGEFSRAGVRLRFLRTRVGPYDQTAPGFIPNLSILDLLANLDTHELVGRLTQYDLI